MEKAMKKHNEVLAILFLISIFATACQNITPTTTIPVKTSTSTSFPTVTSPPPTPTFTPTPIPPPESLASQVSPQCETAFSATVSNKKPAGPVLVMLKRTYEADTDWHYSYLLRYHTAQAAADVKTIFCIQESRNQSTSYQDGEAGYRLKWDVRVVEMESGLVIGSQSFNGENAPGVKFNSGPGYGRPPFDQLVRWVTDNVEDPSVFFIGESVSALTFSPDGKFLVAANGRVNGVVYSGTTFPAKIFIINMENGEVLTLSGHNDSITQLAISSDSTMLASSHMINKTTPPTESLIKIWDLNSGREINSTKVEGIITGLGFSPDKSTLAVLLWDKTPLIEIESGKTISDDEPNSRSFFINSLEMEQGWDMAQQMNIIAPGSEMSSDGSFFILSPNEDFLVEGSRNGFIKIRKVMIP
jgi:WD40 repeat protein